MPSVALHDWRRPFLLRNLSIKNNFFSMARNIITAIDVGTSMVETVIAEERRGESRLHILGIGHVPSAGVRRGIVVDVSEAASAIRRSVDEAQKSASVPIHSVWLAVGGAHISVASSRGVVAVSRADGEISPEDVNRVIAAAETFVSHNPNKEILHIIPRDFKVDNESGIKDPTGMHGVRLEVDTLIIECVSPFLKNLFKAVEGAGFAVDDYVFSSLAASEVVLSKRQKELGTMLLDVGGSTASFIVFEEGVPIHAGVMPIGGAHITNDVAIGFRTHVDIAEKIKLAFGSCLPGDFQKKEAIHLADFLSHDAMEIGEAQEDSPAAGVKEGAKEIPRVSYSRRELAEIIEARLQDLFELLGKDLKKIGRTELLPGGVVLVGGSAHIPGLAELTRQEIKLPVEVGVLSSSSPAFDEKLAPSFAACLGVLEWAHRRTGESVPFWGGRIRKIRQSPWLRWLRSLLP